jgi:hypothetical protein
VSVAAAVRTPPICFWHEQFQRTDVNGQASIALTSAIAGDNTISIYYVVNDQTFTLPDFSR